MVMGALDKLANFIYRLEVMGKGEFSSSKQGKLNIILSPKNLPAIIYSAQSR